MAINVTIKIKYLKIKGRDIPDTEEVRNHLDSFHVKKIKEELEKAFKVDKIKADIIYTIGDEQ